MDINEKTIIKTNFLAAHIVNEIAKWIEKNSKDEFFKATGYNNNSFIDMAHLTFKWTLEDVAIVSAALDKKIFIFIEDTE